MFIELEWLLNRPDAYIYSISKSLVKSQKYIFANYSDKYYFSLLI